MRWLLMPLQWNFVLVTALLGSISAQLIKVILNLIIIGRFIPERVWGAGGMPSSHSATVCAMLVATGRYCGPDSSLFAVAVVVSIIVMYDAMGVRRETGEQAKVLNQMLNEWMDEGAQNFPWLADKRLKEMVGHTPIQVLAGAILGVLIGFIVPMP
ncbi:divergent PAP2 family protein [uncultured Gemmiger sp.]|uniref:divergent PAP2 family protein n=1 Tax=uncultured Gemmiger sp. TaxID=1623490 RepID=UPI0025E018DE|nr:divergent PAP2 family protein [uncultured Gemmiger sp.]